MYRTISEIRSAFWESHPEFIADYRTKKRQNDYKADIRTAFCDWLDSIHKDGLVSDRLRESATL
jgi:hypothetical protein